ncbi:MAG: porin, partial [Hydrogenophaga sp.]|uniref:porin n=1 Tax=Hydrogenophaga sp. TaxID=1904254 RepID=UPI002AB9F639
MKKSLIAIAVLAAAGAASAQSSLNLYGVADVWIGKAKGADAQLGSGGLAGSRVGFKGTEDLGGGLKAHFTLEQGVDLDTGSAAAAGLAFSRQAHVGFSGGFGSVKLGRSFTALDDINGAANSGFDSALSATNNVWVAYTASVNDQIYYATPEMGGLSGAVGFNLSGDATDITSMHVKYSNGPIYVGAALQSDKSTTAGTNIQHMLLNGTYDLGMATIKAAYRTVKNPVGGAFTNPKATEYTFGLDYPVNSNLTLSVGYANSKIKATSGVLSGTTRDSVGYDFAAGYSLSKRTTVYGGFNSTKTNGVKDSFVA